MHFFVFVLLAARVISSASPSCGARVGMREPLCSGQKRSWDTGFFRVQPARWAFGRARFCVVRPGVARSWA
eukprot:444498-Prymnesium_polylepis.1